MRRLTTVGLSDWLHVLRPSPARLERAFEDARAIEIDEISVALIDELTRLVGSVHLLDIEPGHFPPSRFSSGIGGYSRTTRSERQPWHTPSGESSHDSASRRTAEWVEVRRRSLPTS